MRATTRLSFVIVAAVVAVAGCSLRSSEDEAAEVTVGTPQPTTGVTEAPPPTGGQPAPANGGTTQAPAPTSAAPQASDSPVSTSPSPTAAPDREAPPPEDLEIVAYPVPQGSRPHDVAPAADGGVWYTAQGSGDLGWLDPATGETRHIPLGRGSRPHGVIVGPDGHPWITDGGRNSIIRVDAQTGEITEWPLPGSVGNANLNTAAFDPDGIHWFTGQDGIYGMLDPETGQIEVFEAPRGRGPYGITTTPAGMVYYASLAGSYVGRVDAPGAITVLEPPTAGQGARRVWSDSGGEIWVSEWNAGQLSRYDPATQQWTTWRLPGRNPSAYAVYVDEFDIVWVSDFGGNSIHRFDPATETFFTFPLPHDPGNVRQILGRPGEIWGAESAADQLVVIRAP